MKLAPILRAFHYLRAAEASTDIEIVKRFLGEAINELESLDLSVSLPPANEAQSGGILNQNFGCLKLPTRTFSAVQHGFFLLGIPEDERTVLRLLNTKVSQFRTVGAVAFDNIIRSLARAGVPFATILKAELWRSSRGVNGNAREWLNSAMAANPKGYIESGNAG